MECVSSSLAMRRNTSRFYDQSSESGAGRWRRFRERRRDKGCLGVLYILRLIAEGKGKRRRTFPQLIKKLQFPCEYDCLWHVLIKSSGPDVGMPTRSSPKHRTRFWVYVLGSKRKLDRRTYVGWTTDLERRLTQHNAGNGAKSTRGRQWVLLYSESWATKRKAMSREWYIKRDGRSAKNCGYMV
jgi:putative endonuclease